MALTVLLAPSNEAESGASTFPVTKRSKKPALPRTEVQLEPEDQHLEVSRLPEKYLS